MAFVDPDNVTQKGGFIDPDNIPEAAPNVNAQPAAKTEQKGFMARVGDKFDKRISEAEQIKNNPKLSATDKKLGYARKGMQMFTDTAGEAISAVTPGFVERGVQAVGKGIIDMPMSNTNRTTVGDVAHNVGQAYDAFSQRNPRTANALNTAGSAVNTGAQLSMIKPTSDLAKKGITKTKAAIESGITKTAETLEKGTGTANIKNLVRPEPTKKEALGQILQGKTKDIAKGEKALAAVDTSKVKTYQDLSKVLDDSIPEYSKKVDAELLKDPKKYKLNELSTDQKLTTVEEAPQSAGATPRKVIQSKAAPYPHGGGFTVIDENGSYMKGQGGHPIYYPTEEQASSAASYANNKATELAKNTEFTSAPKPETTVKVNHVETSLQNLSELYKKIGEKGKAIDAENILRKAKTQGLTKIEVNNIARQYNVEFGDKAFSKATQEPLTSVNAQAYENTRKGLKDVARRGLSDEAKELDNTLHSIYNTKALIQKNVEAVNKLRQKIDQRGLGEKIGRGVLTAIDMATFGMAKGAVLKLLPRGMGYKIKNAIDLEESLKRNLNIVNKALSAKTDAEMANTIKKGFQRGKGTPQSNSFKSGQPAYQPESNQAVSE